jgi:SAM-dependent methyltransferase
MLFHENDPTEFNAALPSWKTLLSPIEQQSFAGALQRMSEIFPEILDLEKKYSFLEKFEFVRESLISSRKKLSGVDHLYRELVFHYAMTASYAPIYERLAANGEINPQKLENLLDLGAGYWNSSLVYQKMFPNLKKAVGIEIEDAKIKESHEVTFKFFGIDKEKFQFLHGNFMQAVNFVEGPFDLALMQSYFPYGARDGNLYYYSSPDPNTPEDYKNLFKNIAEKLAPDGKLIVTLDMDDYQNSGIARFSELLAEMGAVIYAEKRIARTQTFGVDIAKDVALFVLNRSALAGES